MNRSEQYAIDMIIEGAESAVDSDLNARAEVTTAEHILAVDLAQRILRGARAHPANLRALAEVVPMSYRCSCPQIETTGHAELARGVRSYVRGHPDPSCVFHGEAANDG